MWAKMKLLFQEEMGELIKKGKFTRERKEKYRKWVADADKARSTDPLDARMNQYDKAEELLTWYTFAPLLRMNTGQRILTINEFLNPLLGSDAIVSHPCLDFEKMLLPSKSYCDELTADHPIRYIREEIKSHRKHGITLEKYTHIDVMIETDELVVPIEAKFTSDIDCQRKYACIRNQIARTIDVSMEASKKAQPPKKVLFLLCVPKNLYNEGRYYYYKIRDYGNLENLKHDLPHQAGFFETYFLSAYAIFWEDVASRIIGNAVKWKLLNTEELKTLREFYDERLIKLTLE